MYALLALVALPLLARAAPHALERRAGLVYCDPNANIPNWDDCETILVGLRQGGEDVVRERSLCTGRCCLTWSRDCPERNSELLWRAESIKAGCATGHSGVFANAGSCLGTVCISDRQDGCVDSPDVDVPWK
jgi:hypothetical protein